VIGNFFGKYDKKKSSANAQKWLSEYWDWRDEAKKKTLTIGSPNLDGLPTGNLYDADYKLVDYVNAEREWKIRENMLTYISSKGDEHELYAQILDYRFVHHHWKMDKVAMKLHLPKRTCERMQDNALWEVAKVCPDKSVLVPK